MRRLDARAAAWIGLIDAFLAEHRRQDEDALKRLERSRRERKPDLHLPQDMRGSEHEGEEA